MTPTVEEQIELVKSVNTDIWIYRESGYGNFRITHKGIFRDFKITEEPFLRFVAESYYEFDGCLKYSSGVKSGFEYIFNFSIATSEQIEYFTQGKEHNSLEEIYPKI